MVVRQGLRDAPVLYAVNGTRQNAAISYTVTAFSATGEGKEIACGTWEQAANSSTALLAFAEPQEPQLWVIRWQLAGRTYTNHFFTGKADLETYRRFVRILAEAGGFDKELAELS